MKKFAEMVTQNSALIIGLTILITVFFAYQLKDIEVNSDIVSYLKPDDPAVIIFNRIGEEYAGTALAMVGIESENVFDYKTLTTINTITENIKQIDGVANVMSLTDVLDIKDVDGGLEVGRLIDKNNIPSDPEELNHIRDYALSKDMYNGRILSPDGKVTIIIARLKQHSDKSGIAAEIKQLAMEDAAGYKLYFSGIPMQMNEISDIIIDDMLYLVPAVAFILILVLYFSFRSKRGVILPLLTVMISTIWALGLMAFLDVQLSMVSNIMPVILIAVGSAYGIHMISRYYEDIGKYTNKTLCIQKALSEVGIPIILAGVTTLIGFLSFIGSYLTSVTDFGVFSAIGVGFALIISITFIPAVLTLLKPPKIKKTDDGEEDNILAHFMKKLASVILRSEKLTLLISAIIIIVAVIGVPQLKRSVNMLDYFENDTDIRIAEQMMQKNFGGSTPIQVVVKGDLKNPFVLKDIRKLEKFMETVPYVGKPQSIADLICEMNKVMNGTYTIPDTREGVSNLWFFIESESIMEQLVNADASEGIIQANLGSVDTKHILDITDKINEFLVSLDSTPLIAVKNVDVKNPAVIEYLVNDISKSINLDFIRYRTKPYELNSALLKDKIRSISTNGIVQFSDSTLSIIENQLKDFFRYESEIILNSEKDITRLTIALVHQLKNNSNPNEQTLINIISKNVPSSIVRNKEDINETAHSLSVILLEQYYLEKTVNAVAILLPLFPAELQSNQKFRDDLRDDLWVLNENNIALPKAITNKTGMAGTTIKEEFVQSGMPLIFTHIDKSLMKSQFQSLIIAIVLVTLLLIFQLKSFWGGIIAVSPIVLTVLLNFAVMSYLNVPLDIATILVASIAIGIGIDYTIHFTNRFKVEFSKDKTPIEALEKTLNSTGRAILINALSVSLGFLVLMFAQLIPIQRFGWLTATTMVFSAAGALTFLPALILLTKARFIGNFNRFDSLKNSFKKKINSVKNNHSK